MILLVSGATRTLRSRRGSKQLGHLVVPGAGNKIETLLATGLPICADNGAFTFFDEPAFVRMLGQLQGKPCHWVCAPDIVGDAAATLALFDVWEPVIRSYGLPVALVAQDGLEDLQVPWERIDCLFLGGSTRWKLGPEAERLAREAKRRGKLLHGGRVNTWRRFRYMASIGCDSVDGSGFSRWPSRIDSGLKWLDDLESQLSLDLAA